MAVLKRAKKPGSRKPGTAGSAAAKQAQNARIAEETAKCYELQLKGYSLREIGAEVGLSHQTVKNRIQKAISERLDPKTDEYRSVMFDRCERLLKGLDDAIEAGDEKAVNAYVRVLERQARLMGMDAPVQVESTVREAEPDESVINRIEDAKKKAAAKRIAAQQAMDAATEISSDEVEE